METTALLHLNIQYFNIETTSLQHGNNSTSTWKQQHFNIETTVLLHLNIQHFNMETTALLHLNIQYFNIETTVLQRGNNGTST